MIQPIDKEKCIGCGLCIRWCPMDVIYMDADGKASARYVEDCQCCDNCEDACPTKSIYVSPAHDTPPMLSWY